jgi:hypothetical protein
MSGGAKPGGAWVGRNEGAVREKTVMSPDEPLYTAAIGRVGDAAKKTKEARDKSFKARIGKLISEPDPKKREALERDMRKEDEAEAKAKAEAKEAELDRRDRVKAASESVAALRATTTNPKKQSPKKK